MHNAPIDPLLPLFERERAANRAMAIGILLATEGSTYRKPGALMLIAASGEYAGLLSGGCLEGDLQHYAEGVIDTGQPRFVDYDTRGTDDALWGIGLGCEGAMRILLMRIGPENEWLPMTHLANALDRHAATAVGIVTDSTDPHFPAGSVELPDHTQDPQIKDALLRAARTGKVDWLTPESTRWKMFVLPLSLPPRLLLLGAGPDALPVVDFASRLGWKTTLVDHRPAYAQASHFPAAERVVLSTPEAMSETLDLASFSACVVMSHHLPSDLKYLWALSSAPIAYVGLLGPPARRKRLLQDLGAQAEELQPRLFAPVGLPIGGRTPESIALSIVAEIHAFVHGAPGIRTTTS